MNALARRMVDGGLRALGVVGIDVGAHRGRSRLPAWRVDARVAGIAIITEACIGVKDRACVDVCPVQCIYEYDAQRGLLFSEDEAGSGEVANTHTPNADAIAIFADSLLYVNTEECTSCTACYQPDVCPVGAIYSEEHVPDGSPTSAKYNASDPNTGHDHTFFTQLTRDVFAD